MASAYMVGAGQTGCGRFPTATVASLAIEALDAALDDAGIAEPRIEAIFFSNALSGLMTGQECVAGRSLCGTRATADIPIVNVENACASGSTALHLACQAIDAGAYEAVAVVGSEKMSHPDRRRPIRALEGDADVELVADGPEDHGVFMDSCAERARRRIEEQGWRPSRLRWVVVKNRRHAVHNPGAQFREEMTVAEVLGSRMITEPLTLPMCSPIGDGAAALCSPRDRRAESRAIHVRASALRETGGSARAASSSAPPPPHASRAGLAPGRSM